MKIGVKIWPDDADYAFEIAEHVDFIEVMAKQGEDLSFLQDMDMPFVVHAEHGKLGVNYADASKAALNKSSIDFAIKLADKIDAKAVIIHPGFFDGSPGQSLEQSIGFIQSLTDNRIIIENILLREEGDGKTIEFPFTTPEGMKQLLDATNRRMCLDFSHAHATACMLNISYIDVLEKFVQMLPRHFHACGGVEGEPKDMHIHLWEGTLNIDAFKRMLPKDAWVTLETPTDLEGQIQDIEMMRK